jgi:hypothetical protein
VPFYPGDAFAEAVQSQYAARAPRAGQPEYQDVDEVVARHRVVRRRAAVVGVLSFRLAYITGTL